MEEIQVGEFVRTDGKIGKVTDICDCKMCEERGYFEPIIDNPNIYITVFDKQHDFHGIKHSFNLIDLIEKNDYVNGYKVLDVTEDLSTGILQLEMESSYPKVGSCTLYNEEIHSIVTHEQFTSLEYKVEEK